MKTIKYTLSKDANEFVIIDDVKNVSQKTQLYQTL